MKDYTIPIVAIEKQTERPKDSQILMGETVTVSIPKAGTVELVKTADGFGVRRPGSDTIEMQYTSGQSLTINQPDGTKIVYKAVSESDLEARDFLEPQL